MTFSPDKQTRSSRHSQAAPHSAHATPKRLKTLTDEQYEHLRVPATRKKIASALVASMLCSGILIALSGVLNTVVFIALLFLTTIVIMTCLGSLSIANSGVGEYGEAHVDERQHALGNASYRLAYKFLGITVAVVISVIFVMSMTDIQIPRSVIGGTLVVLWEAIFALPAIAVAFTLKD